MPPKEEVEALMNGLLPFAKKMLSEHGEFYPYGGYMTIEGKIVHVGAQWENEDHPKSQPLIGLLNESFRKGAMSGAFKATAAIYDVCIKLPDTEEKADAIQVCLDHLSGYSVEVLFPYKISGDKKLIEGNVFAQKGNGSIFLKKQ